MKRREFVLSTTTAAAASLALVGLSGLITPAMAQGGAPVEGKDFQRVAQPVPMPEGKVDVVEFFRSEEHTSELQSR